MIRSFETTATRNPQGLFLRFRQPDDQGNWFDTPLTYQQVRLQVGALLGALRSRGLQQGAILASDMQNCPAFVYLFLACMYGGFTLVTLNDRLTSQEKEQRVGDLAQLMGLSEIPVFTEPQVMKLVQESTLSDAQRSGLLAQASALANPESQGIVMFTSGTTGKPKAARLAGRNLTGSAAAANAVLGVGPDTLWQAMLPLYHIGGLQIVVRSLLNGNPLILYRRFNAAVVAADGRAYGATHVSVVDKTLRELMEAGCPPYQAILLGGAKPNEATLARAAAEGLHLFSGYGMTETSSMMAVSAVGQGHDAELSLLPGYEARIVSPDASGTGQLAVRGPGIFGGYLGVATSLTADGFFLTGDRARISNRAIVISERVGDMFVSGGENVYPEEIRAKILSIPGVTDAYVYGAPDEEWGRRPVALVEMANTKVNGANAALLAAEIRTSLKTRLARIYQPDRIFVMQEFDRVGIGKVDRRTLQARAECAVNVKQVEAFHVRLPLQHPVRTAKVTMTCRDSLILRVTDSHGQTGLGECVAFDTPWYLPETLGQCWDYLEKQLIPCVLREAFLQPDEVRSVFATLPDAARHPLACGALEPALWDLYGKNMGCSMTTLIGAKDTWDVRGSARQLPAGVVPGGVVLGLASVQETLAAAKLAVDRGYTRLKLKIAPGCDVERVRAVREAFPQVTVVLDANQSYTEADEVTLRTLDSLGCACIEEPLNPAYVPSVGPKDLFSRLSRLQRSLSTPIALDESWVTMEDALEALSHPDLRCLVMKVAKCGGIMAALELYWRARSCGATVWMGGMYDTGISKRLHGAFSLLPGVALPGDINDTSYYFDTDVSQPPFTLDHGMLTVNPPGYPNGLGCDLNEEALAKVIVEKRIYK